MTKWLLLGAAILTEVTASLTLKAALERPVLYTVVATGFIAAFALLTAVLRRGMPLGVAYGIWAAAGVALTTTLSWLIYAEPFTPVMAVGVVLIIGGVLLVEMGSHPATQAPTTDPSR